MKKRLQVSGESAMRTIVFHEVLVGEKFFTRANVATATQGESENTTTMDLSKDLPNGGWPKGTHGPTGPFS